MKKRVLALLVALMVMLMGTVAVDAAMSPTAQTSLALADAATSSDGDKEMLPSKMVLDCMNFAQELVDSFITAETIGTPQGAPAQGSALDKIMSDFAIAEGVSADKLTVIPEVKAAFEFTPNSKVAKSLKNNGSAEVTFKVDGVKKGASIVILHYVDNEWEVIVPTSVKNGQVTAVFNSFSPIAIVELTAATQVVASPKTGEIMTLLGGCAVLCLAGVTFCGRKAKENK